MSYPFSINKVAAAETAHIRCAVYCDELGYEQPSAPGAELDEFDAHALHAIISDEHGPIGCVRVIRNVAGGTLPFQVASDVALEQFQPGTVGEVSRLAILPERRHIQSRGFPVILPAIYMSALALAKLNNVSTLFIFCQKRLAEHLQHLGVTMLPVGKYVEYRGLRAAHIMDVTTLVAVCEERHRALWQHVYHSISSA